MSEAKPAGIILPESAKPDQSLSLRFNSITSQIEYQSNIEDPYFAMKALQVIVNTEVTKIEKVLKEINEKQKLSGVMTNAIINGKRRIA